MSARMLVLYLRSRAIPYALAVLTALVVLVVLVGSSSRWLRHGQATLAVVAAVLAATLLGGSLESPSPELDATAVLNWRRWRTTHAAWGLVICALPLAIVIAAHPSGPIIDPAAVRNVLGFAGLAMLGAVAMGSRLSWTLPVAYALITRALPRYHVPWGQVWRWPFLSGGIHLSWWPAIGLCLAGALLSSAPRTLRAGGERLLFSRRASSRTMQAPGRQ